MLGRHHLPLLDPVDLALLVYVQLPAPQRLKAIMSAWNCLAPGGILLVIDHHTDNLINGVGGPQDPNVLYSDRDVIADLGAIDCSARFERTERAARPVAGYDRPALETVVRAHKLGPDASPPAGAAAVGSGGGAHRGLAW